MDHLVLVKNCLESLSIMKTKSDPTRLEKHITSTQKTMLLTIKETVLNTKSKTGFL